MSNVSSKKPPVSEAVADKPVVVWGPAAAVVVTIVAFFLSQILAGVLVGLVPSLRHWSMSQIQDWLATTSGQFVYVLVAEALTVGVLYWFLRRRKANPRSLGFFRRPNWTDLGYALIGFVVYFALLIAASLLAGNLFNVDVNQPQELGFHNVFGLSDKLLVLFSLVILPPVVEETVFRGFLYGGLRTKLKIYPAMLITSVLFAAPHLLESQNGSLLWIAGIDTFVLSLVLCYLREKTGNLWASIGVHMLKNGLAYVAIFFAHVAH